MSIQINLLQWKCGLKSCNDCPKYKIPIVESNESIYSPKIKFHICKAFTIFSKHGDVGPSNLLCDVCSNVVHVE